METERPRVTVESVREFWDRKPVGYKRVFDDQTTYDFLRYFDNTRERDDVEPYAFSNRIHGYDRAQGLAVLDYGCGNGYVLANYAKRGARVVGVDVSSTALRLARERFRIMALAGTLVQGDGRSVPVRSASFDIVCSMGVLHHIPEPASVVRELYRVLKPGGRIIVMLYNRFSYRYQVHFRLAALRSGRPLEELVKLNDGEGNPCGRVYSRDDVRRLLGDFVDHTFVVGQFGIGEFAFHSPRLVSVLSRLFPVRFFSSFLAAHVGWNLYCTAVKPR